MIITSFVGILVSSQSRVESSEDHSPQQQQNRDDNDDDDGDDDDGDDRKADNVLSSSINHDEQQDVAYIEDVYADVDHETKQNNADIEEKDQVSQLSLQYFIPTSACSPHHYCHHPYHYYEDRYHHHHFQRYHHHHHFSCVIILYLMFYSLVLDSLQCS
jgi:hypothetical protein